MFYFVLFSILCIIELINGSDINVRQPNGIQCCEFVVIRWSYQKLSQWKPSDRINIELWEHNRVTPNKKIASITNNISSQVFSTPGYTWQVPRNYLSIIKQSSKTDVYFRLYKMGHSTINSEPIFVDDFRITGCPKLQCPLPPTVSTTTRAMTTRPTPLPPLESTSTITMTTLSSSSSASLSAMTSSLSLNDTKSSGTSTTGTVDTSVFTGTGSPEQLACHTFVGCEECSSSAACFYCGDDDSCQISLGGWFGPGTPVSHFVANLFLDDGATCQKWFFKQCKVEGRIVVYIVFLGMLSFCCCTCCLVCFIRKRRKRNGRYKGDRVPLIAAVKDNEEEDDEDVVSEEFQGDLLM